MKTISSLALVAGIAVSRATAAELPDFSRLIEKNAAAVVQIDGRTTSSAATQPQQMTPEDFFRYFFDGRGGLPQIPHGGGSAHGSGFFIDAEGYILTNAHVVKDSDEITVSTTEKKEYLAELVGMDERADVALLKIKNANNPTVAIGNSDKLKVGNWVLAIGSPFGFDYTATAGIVSAVSRSLPDGNYVPFIQTDAAVNPGNSGGPLFNLAGEVIGINSQIYSNTGSFNGLAFAIPINTAMNIAEQLKNKGYVSRGWLGVGFQPVSHELAKSFALDKPMGALIVSVSPDGPAAEGGVKIGDIILKFNGKTIGEATDLPPLVGATEAGKAVAVEVLRNGKKENLTVTLGELEKIDGQGTSTSNQLDNDSDKQDLSVQGMTVRPLAMSQKDELGIDAGVVIVSLDPNSAAAKAGFRRGDVIVNVNNRGIDSVATFDKAIRQRSGDKPLAVLVIRSGRSLFIAF